MKIINSSSIFNIVNNGFVYLCQTDDGSYWVRSTAGNWVQIKIPNIADTETLDSDFQAFLEKNITVTENDIKVDNSSQVIVPVSAKVEEITP